MIFRKGKRVLNHTNSRPVDWDTKDNQPPRITSSRVQGPSVSGLKCESTAKKEWHTETRSRNQKDPKIKDQKSIYIIIIYSNSSYNTRFKN